MAHPADSLATSDYKNPPCLRGTRDGSPALALGLPTCCQTRRVQIADCTSQTKPPQKGGLIRGAPGAIRTRNPRLRRAMLYPVEPRVHLRIYYKCLSVNCKALTMPNNPVVKRATRATNLAQEAQRLRYCHLGQFMTTDVLVIFHQNFVRVQWTIPQ